jgi:hypothetical protein
MHYKPEVCIHDGISSLDACLYLAFFGWRSFTFELTQLHVYPHFAA